MTDTTTVDATTEYVHTHTYIGGTWMQLNQTDSTGNEVPMGSQNIEVFAMMPEFFDEYSMVGIETRFITKLPNDHISKGEYLQNWISYPVTEEVE